MKVCIPCRREMNCLKTGARLVFGDSHVYACDLFVCPNCGQVFANGNEIPYYDPGVLKGGQGHVYVIDGVDAKYLDGG